MQLYCRLARDGGVVLLAVDLLMMVVRCYWLHVDLLMMMVWCY